MAGMNKYILIGQSTRMQMATYSTVPETDLMLVRAPAPEGADISDICFLVLTALRPWLLQISLIILRKIILCALLQRLQVRAILIRIMILQKHGRFL